MRVKPLLLGGGEDLNDHSISCRALGGHSLKLQSGVHLIMKLTLELSQVHKIKIPEGLIGDAATIIWM